MDLARLRQKTALDHAGTEGSVPLMSDTLTRTEYADLLRRFFRIVSAWDCWADAHVPQDLLSLLQGRRRASLLLNDLHALGEEEHPEQDVTILRRMQETTVTGDPRSVFLGRMYVMEGSTLGGQYIARHVEEQLGLHRGAGNSFFDGYGDQTAMRWREFRSVLASLPETEADTVIASARNMFALFEEAVRDDRGCSTLEQTNPLAVSSGISLLENITR